MCLNQALGWEHRVNQESPAQKNHYKFFLSMFTHIHIDSSGSHGAGGTTNIMKNILGERVLGLPGEPRMDKELPWSEVPRS